MEYLSWSHRGFETLFIRSQATPHRPLPHQILAADREASPGKLAAFDEELFSNTEMLEVPVVMAVSLAYVEGSRTLGVASCDASGRSLAACEFADDEHFCTLEAVICQLGAKEVVVPKVLLCSRTPVAVIKAAKNTASSVCIMRTTSTCCLRFWDQPKVQNLKALAMLHRSLCP